MMLKAKGLILLLSILMLMSCYKDKLASPSACSKPTYYKTSLPTSEANQVYYLINRTCNYAGCHGANLTALDTYQELLPYILNDGFRNRVIVLRNVPTYGMPWNGGSAHHELTPAELDTVQCWVNGGYLETN